MYKLIKIEDNCINVFWTTQEIRIVQKGRKLSWDRFSAYFLCNNMSFIIFILIKNKVWYNKFRESNNGGIYNEKNINSIGSNNMFCCISKL